MRRLVKTLLPQLVDQRRPGGVERGERRTGGPALGGLRGGQREHEGVARRLLEAVRPVSRARRARVILRRAVDLDPLDADELERHPGERGGGLRRKAPAGRVRPDPVADLEPAGPDARMQARAAEDALLARVEDAVDRVGAEVELAPELTQEL